MYFIVEDSKIFETSSEAAEYITDNMDDDYYDEMLDECYEETEIAGYTYQTSYALKELDPVAYRCGKNDYFSSLSSDIDWELDRMDSEDVQDFYGFEVEAIYDLDEIREMLDELEEERIEYIEEEDEEGINSTNKEIADLREMINRINHLQEAID